MEVFGLNTTRRSFSNEELLDRFGYHAGTDETKPRHAEVRREFLKLATILDEILPAGRAKSVCLTELENASMWANKAIAEEAPLVREGY